MTCACGEKMKRRERIVNWEKLRWWECPKCHATKPIPRPEEDTKQ